MADDFGNGEAMDLPVGKDAVNRLIRENSHIFSDSHCKVCSAVLISESQKLAHYQSKKHANKYRRYTSIHQGEDYTPAKRMKTDDTLQNASDDTDRNKCCPVCNMTFSSPVVAMSHYTGKTHSKNLKLLEQGGVPQVSQGAPRVPKPAPPRVTPEVADKSDPDKFCKLCNATFNNPHMAEQHYKGRRHQKQETKSKLMTIYTSSGNTLPKNAPLNPQTPGSGATGNWYTCDTCNVVVNSIEQYQAHITGAKHKNNLKAMVTTHSDSVSPVLKRKSYGGNTLSNPLSSSGDSSAATGFSSSSGGRFSSSTGNFSSFPGNFSSFPGNFSSSSGNFSSSSGNFSSSGNLSSSSGNLSSSAGNFSSSSGNLSSSAGNFSSSSGNLSSSAGNFSSSYGFSNAGSSAPSEGLLPLPSYATEAPRPYMKSLLRSDDYNYFHQNY